MKDEQKLAFRRLVTALENRDHVLRAGLSGMSWDQAEVPVRGDLAALHEHLKAHNVGEIRFPIGLMTSALLSLLKILAAPAGTYASFDHLISRLDAAGVGTVPILPMQATSERPAQPPPPPPKPPVPPPVRAVERRPAPIKSAVDDDGRLADLGPDALTEAKVGMMHFVTTESKALTPMDLLISQLAAEQDEARAMDLLNQLISAADHAASSQDWVTLLRGAFGLVQLEARGGPAVEHRGYGITLRRVLPRSTLERLVRMVARGEQRAEAVVVLKRMGADGTEVLLKHLAESEDIGERRQYYNALKDMTEGTSLLIHMLSHDQWFVVRNVVELCAELKLEPAVPALTKLMAHDEERVRKAAAAALGRIGGSAAAEGLRKAFNDPSPAVRMHAAQELDGRRAKGMAMTLAVAAEEEQKSDVQREMYLALGRIGSVEAIQALLKVAEPVKGFFRRKPSARRLAAVAGLHAAGPSGANALKTLLSDDDKQVRAAVEKALGTLWA
jgi:HEAT repeat protein